jgi:hypothetical protein
VVGVEDKAASGASAMVIGNKPLLLPRLMHAAVLLGGFGFGTQALATNISGVPRVVDGDTLEVAAVKIRLEGIDAPEAIRSVSIMDRLSGRVVSPRAIGFRNTSAIAQSTAHPRVRTNMAARSQYAVLPEKI